MVACNQRHAKEINYSAFAKNAVVPYFTNLLE